MTRILIIDPQFDDDPDLERAVAGSEFEFEVVRPGADPTNPEALRRADAVVNCRSRHKLPEALIDQMERARIVVQAGVGYDHIDIAACARRGIPVCNTPDYGTMEVADHAIALMLGLTRAVTTYNNRLLARDDAWNTTALPAAPVRRLSGQTFGVIGLGRIGLAAALRAKAFGMEILFHDPYLPVGIELSLGFSRAPDLSDLLARADVVSVHTPLSAETEYLIDVAAIAAMKPTAILINTSRGRTVDLDAVHRGLREGEICAAALDVLPVEPLDRSHPLIAAWSAGEPWLEGRLILTPHAAFYTPESLADMRTLSMTAVVQFLKHGTLRSCVNLDILARQGH